jgi:hypothetical protein
MDKKQQIRELAYYIWIQEGRPDGRHDEHWYQAMTQVTADVSFNQDPAEQQARKAPTPRLSKLASAATAEARPKTPSTAAR